MGCAATKKPKPSDSGPKTDKWEKRGVSSITDGPEKHLKNWRLPISLDDAGFVSTSTAMCVVQPAKFDVSTNMFLADLRGSKDSLGANSRRPN
jgi:hypothetical protein